MLARRMVVLAAITTVLLSGVAGSTALSVDRAAVLAALRCPATFSRPRLPVVLVHGTGSTAEESWSHTFAKTLPLDGWELRRRVVRTVAVALLPVVLGALAPRIRQS